MRKKAAARKKSAAAPAQKATAQKATAQKATAQKKEPAAESREEVADETPVQAPSAKAVKPRAPRKGGRRGIRLRNGNGEGIE
ncbi:MAG TPA: hypothetical protein ENK50_07520 [Sedimenticola sp.]|nr:hypothetical protein [Sedimenticola sp.]